jgi:hypothetical protein
MNYRVSWDPAAFKSLAAIWATHPDVDELTQCLDEIHRLLSVAADEQGESRGRGQRVVIMSPLGVVFQAQTRLAEVLIIRIWRFRKR